MEVYVEIIYHCYTFMSYPFLNKDLWTLFLQLFLQGKKYGTPNNYDKLVFLTPKPKV